MPIKIEHAEGRDIGAMMELLKVLFSIEKDFIADEVAQRRGLGLLLASPDQGQIFVARHRDAGVVGMVSAQLVISTAIGAPSAWIEDLVISHLFRGQGIGQALLENAREWACAKGAQRIQLLADADNWPALQFYQHLDWQPTRLVAWKKKLVSESGYSIPVQPVI